ncbi:hypothetical protein GCM10010502_58610 [Kitasatospora aureofaciens]|uniref:Uncharacterized protein n=1 Tax=Kitasatospora aureofaciens TaxID=1894 RepID=A0A8H9HX84_KITAU|nr:hypothetical protein GCM10010502_58610 [Kitasatospora aureofaciens]
MVAMAAHRTRSIAIITGRLRRNSTHGASGTAISAPTAGPTADSADTSAGPACNASTAISGRAPNPSPDPYALTAYAAQSQPNCGPSRFLPVLRHLPVLPVPPAPLILSTMPRTPSTSRSNKPTLTGES